MKTMTAERFAALSPRQRGYAVYMCGARPDKPHVPDESNPYTRATWEHLEWGDGQRQAMQADAGFMSQPSAASEELRRLWVACLVEDDQGRLLLAERRSLREIDPGVWGPPGGKARVGETIIATAVREFAEETGAELRLAKVLGFADCDARGLVMFVTGIVSQELRCMEPDKMRDWEWHGPETDVPVQKGIRAYWDGEWERVIRSEPKPKPAKCTKCRGSGIVAAQMEYMTEPCNECQGSGMV